RDQDPGAERRRLRQPARAPAGAGSRRRPRRLHDDRAGARGLRRRVPRRGDARDRRGGNRSRAGCEILTASSRQGGAMSIHLEADDPWVKRGYGQATIEPGERPAVLTIDLQYAFTDPDFIFGGAELIERATVNIEGHFFGSSVSRSSQSRPSTWA